MTAVTVLVVALFPPSADSATVAFRVQACSTATESVLPHTSCAAMAIAHSTALGLGYPVLTEYLRTGLVPRFPTAILATGLMILAFLSFTSGLVLETVTRGRKELKRLAYLTIPGPR